MLCVLLPDLQRYKENFRCGKLGSTTLSKTSDANIDCASVENALVFIDPKIGRAHGPPRTPVQPSVRREAGKE